MADILVVEDQTATMNNGEVDTSVITTESNIDSTVNVNENNNKSNPDNEIDASRKILDVTTTTTTTTPVPEKEASVSLQTTDETSITVQPNVTAVAATSQELVQPTSTPVKPPTEASKKVQPAVATNAKPATNSTSISRADSGTVQTLQKENEALKEKVNKLKTLLGKSAKVQRDTKIEYDQCNKKYIELQKENDKLNLKVQKLLHRPSHMDMIADFETNFDRALLSVTAKSSSSGGSDHHHQSHHLPNGSASPVLTNGRPTIGKNENEVPVPVVDTLLLHELNDSKQRIEQLEKLNTSLMNRNKQYENEIVNNYQRQINDYKKTIQSYEMEKKMLQMQLDLSSKQLQRSQASVDEMQLEISLLSTSCQKAQARATAAETQLQSTASSTTTIQQLQDQINALQEWAIASNEAKGLAQRRIRTLENQIEQQKKHLLALSPNGNTKKTTTNGTTIDGNTNVTISTSVSNDGPTSRMIVSKSGSLVVGAGDIGYRFIELQEDIVKTILLSERVVLRWKFDLQNEQLDIKFSIIKGSIFVATGTTPSTGDSENDNESPKKINISLASPGDYLIKDRSVVGGAEGETDHAFTKQRSCTLVWNNQHSWIRPKTVKYTIDVVVL